RLAHNRAERVRSGARRPALQIERLAEEASVEGHSHVPDRRTARIREREREQAEPGVGQRPGVAVLAAEQDHAARPVGGGDRVTLASGTGRGYSCLQYVPSQLHVSWTSCPHAGASVRSSGFLFTRRRTSSQATGDGRGTPSAAPAC